MIFDLSSVSASSDWKLFLFCVVCSFFKLERLDEKCAELEEQLQKEQSRSLGELSSLVLPIVSRGRLTMVLPHHFYTFFMIINHNELISYILRNDFVYSLSFILVMVLYQVVFICFSAHRSSCNPEFHSAPH